MSRFASLILFTTLAAGCVTTEEGFVRPHEPVPVAAARAKDPPPAPGGISQVHAAWEGRLMETRDVLHNGAPLIGLVGRMYLFGPEVGHTLIGDGAAEVELSDLGQIDPQGKPKLLEVWKIDKANLKRMLKKDMIGWGYTLFLPWSTYKPDINKVQLQVRYVPDTGWPLFAPPAVVALRSYNQLTRTERQTLPAPALPPSAGAAPAAPPPPVPAQP